MKMLFILVLFLSFFLVQAGEFDYFSLENYDLTKLDTSLKKTSGGLLSSSSTYSILLSGGDHDQGHFATPIISGSEFELKQLITLLKANPQVTLRGDQSKATDVNTGYGLPGFNLDDLEIQIAGSSNYLPLSDFVKTEDEDKRLRDLRAQLQRCQDTISEWENVVHEHNASPAVSNVARSSLNDIIEAIDAFKQYGEGQSN